MREMCATGEAREIRLRAHVSLVKVAEASGTTFTTIGRWERNERTPTASPAALRYCDTLDALKKAVPA
jgi:transcriptional regulator with XRE-family HTH domain